MPTNITVKKFIGFSVLVFFILLAWSLITPVAKDQAYYTNPRPAVLVIAHQGGDGLWPGNTLYAFQHAADIGADVLEMDLHITQDGVLVLMHDETVDRTTNGSGLIEEMSLAELKLLDAGYDWSEEDGKTYPFRGQGITVPTLQEVFEAFPQYRMVIEIKKSSTSMIKPFCDLIKEYDMQDKIVVASFYDDKLAAFQAECPEVATSAARTDTTLFVLASKVYLHGLIAPSYASLQVPAASSGITIMSEQFVAAAHALNLKVEPWTINDPEQMALYISWGVDGIITDRPDLLINLLKK